MINGLDRPLETLLARELSDRLIFEQAVTGPSTGFADTIQERKNKNGMPDGASGIRSRKNESK
jgi:hypothetical protein